MGAYTELPRSQRIPEYLEDSPETLTMVAALTEGAISTVEAAKDAGAQLRVKTATWGLNLWEELTGIETDESRTDEERRAAVIARLTGPGVCNAETIERIGREMTGHECSVTEQAGEYSFTLRFNGTGTKPTFEALPLTAIRAAVEEVKPAHLAFIIPGITWGDIESAELTWAGIETEFTSWGDIESRSTIRAKEEA